MYIATIKEDRFTERNVCATFQTNSILRLPFQATSSVMYRK